MFFLPKCVIICPFSPSWILEAVCFVFFAECRWSLCLTCNASSSWQIWKVQCISPGRLSLFKSLEQPNLRGTLFYGWPGYKSVHFCYLLFGGSWDKFLPLKTRSRFYMLSIVSIVSSCIDVACHVNMHFGVSAEKNKEALFHNITVSLF